MHATRALLQHRQPMIRFLGKRNIPAKLDHSPHVHPASPSPSLPSSFAEYRQKAQQHGPLGGQQQSSSISYGGYIGSRSGSSLGSVTPSEGQYFDRNDLPARFKRLAWSQAEIDAIESGGASLF
ncbi:hypothetical protein EJ05DRAFT_484689 [Pseudovirgaria hyperparasitica]|uniref:Ribosomal protein S36, mitochondrial n=1 Tax=Pseudovirgaria hyperparasitica TaxID=470096 RepID=A0A6A6WCU3_9PEZI|nr:uncharacterized protein EJ05DRAFT_484689 [Pseudovirgaria hyperparasitica]KAF2759780.1 hypothetical protein EJ05DRAFT_484689 [Pseudovirgaria hyperparasitica]